MIIAKEVNKMIKMKSVRVNFSNGDSLVTSIDGTDSEIRDYYIGQIFNLGHPDSQDKMVRCDSIEFCRDSTSRRPCWYL